MNFEEIEEIKIKFANPANDTDELRNSLKEMETAFDGQGNLSSWTPEILRMIDKAFVDNYTTPEGEPVSFLFFPNNVSNLNKFSTYCGEVDRALRANLDLAPIYAREYFSYYSLWQMRGLPFPMPLGTASVVDALNKMSRKVKTGFSEVSTPRTTVLSLHC
jgi:hypothetical protein